MPQNGVPFLEVGVEELPVSISVKGAMQDNFVFGGVSLCITSSG